MPSAREDLSPYVGPTPYSNWIIVDRLMAGGYPASLDDKENDELLTVLMRDLGIDTFVCLQTEMDPHVSEHAWRTGRAPRPYTKDIKRLMSANNRHVISVHGVGLPKNVDFLHLPIVDGSVTSDSLLDRFCDDLVGRVLSGKKLYVHCWGGHGRTETVIAVMLGRMYDVTIEQALQRTQLLHDIRGDPQNVGSPSTPPQVAQVKRLLSKGVDTSSKPPANNISKLMLQQKEEALLRERTRRRENREAKDVMKGMSHERARGYAGRSAAVSSPRTPVSVSNVPPSRRWR